MTGFDDKGRQFDLNGNLANWWLDTTLLEFNYRARCFINQVCVPWLREQILCSRNSGIRLDFIFCLLVSILVFQLFASNAKSNG